MTISVACWVLNASCIILTMGTSGYYVVCLNADLMRDYLFIWISLLVLAVAAVLEFLYFCTALVLLIMGTSCYSLARTLATVMRTFDVVLQIVGDFGFLITIFIFNPINGSDDGIFQVIIVFLIGGVKTFLTYTTYLFNYDVSFTSSSEAYVNVPTQEFEPHAEVRPDEKPKTEGPQVMTVKGQRYYLVPANSLLTVYVAPN